MALLQDFYVIFIFHGHGSDSIKIGDLALDNDLFALQFLVGWIAEVDHLVLENGDGKDLVWKLLVEVQENIAF